MQDLLLTDFLSLMPGLRIVGKELGLKYVQFVIDLLHPFLPKIVIDREVEKIKKYARKTTFFS